MPLLAHKQYHLRGTTQYLHQISPKVNCPTVSDFCFDSVFPLTISTVPSYVLVLTTLSISHESRICAVVSERNQNHSRGGKVS